MATKHARTKKNINRPKQGELGYVSAKSSSTKKSKLPEQKETLFT